MILSTKILNKFSQDLFACGYAYQMDIKKLKESGKLDEMLESLDIIPLLKYDLITYLNFLLDEKNGNYYNKKILLEHYFKNELDYNAQYILCLYSNNEEAYRNLPLLLNSLINKLDIPKLKYLNINYLTSLIYKYYDLIDGYDPNIKKYICEFKNKPCGFYTKYEDYDKTYDPKKINVYDTKEFFVWSEHKIYDDEFNALKETNFINNVKWVSREFGDGYGFDILSYDPILHKEKLIEVKSGLSENFCLTENEVSVMQSCSSHDANYYIHKYCYNRDNNTVYKIELKYEPELDMLRDNLNNFYEYTKSEFENQDGIMVTRFNINKVDEKHKQLTLK